MTVDKLKDFVERVAWTAIQAAAATALVALSSDHVDWGDVGKVTGIAALIAALKVIAAQNFGSTPDGAAMPGTIYKQP